jgi:uncharacterized membrane protein
MRMGVPYRGLAGPSSRHMLNESRFNMAVEQTEPPGAASPREMGRLEAFSDGVFAIAITLLILEIPVPEHTDRLLHDVLQRWPSFLAYAISFVIILIMWVNHHTIFRLLERSDRRFLMINGLLLMLITFVNYPTALLASYLTTSEARTATVIYSGTFVVVAICFNVLWRYASDWGNLLSPTADPAMVAAITRAFRFGPLFYFAAFVAAFVSVPLSIAISAGLAIFYAVYSPRNGETTETDPKPTALG